MTQYFDACCLLQFTHQGASVIQQYPKEYTFIQRKKPFLICSFPEKMNNKSIYSFNINRFLCFVWAFEYHGNLYSIVVISHHCFASFFLDFLTLSSIKYANMSPTKRFTIILRLLSKWSLNQNTNQIKLFFPELSFNITLNLKDSFYMRFDPTIYLGTSYKQLNKLWKTLIAGKGLLIVGDDPLIVSNAVYSALSLIAPIKFTDQYLLFTKLGDQRFCDIVDIGEKKWKIVGTTNQLALERCKQFETVIKVGKKHKPQPKLVEMLNKQTSGLVKYFEYFFDKNLAKDPFADFIGLPLSDSQVDEIVSHSCLSKEEFLSFQETQSFKDWRTNFAARREFREVFLSFSPEKTLENRPIEQLIIIENCLKKLKQKFIKDEHFLAVCKKYFKFLKEKKEHFAQTN